MTSADAAHTTNARPASASPGAAFTRVVSTAVEYGVAKVSRTADAVTQKLTTGADEAGATQRAGLAEPRPPCAARTLSGPRSRERGRGARRR